MFEYAVNSHKMKIRIGQYVSHCKQEPYKNKSLLKSPEELNELNRHHLAVIFINSKEGRSFLKDVGTRYDNKQLINDVAQYIDQRIPKAYVKWRDTPNETDEWSIDGTGLIYHFEENHLLEKEIHSKKREYIEQSMKEIYATKKQKDYLSSLLANAGYISKIELDEIDMVQAKKFISFFVDDIELPYELFKLLEYDI